MLKNLYTKITGDPNEKEISRLQPVVEQINSHEPEIQKLSDAQLRAKTDEFKARLADEIAEPRQRVAELREQFAVADTDTRRVMEEELKQAEKTLLDAERTALDDILPEVFACVREASIRTIGLRHFDVQMIGGMVLHEGKIAEMKTGEGKTLVATLPLYLNGLLGRGAHLVTVNDYLARLHTQLMGPIYHFLGLSVASLQQGEEKKALIFDPSFQAATREMNFLRACERQEAYRADITYGTNSEFGFDYLRDNMAWRLEDRVQRELYYAIVDEVDNILIDEARTPLIISGPAGEASDEYYRLAELVRKVSPDHYTIDQRTRGITLTEAGYDRVEELLGQPLTNPDRPEESDQAQAKIMHHLEAAMKAQYLFQRDKDYIVRKGQVIIVDEFTGRLMPGRRWSDGLHQAVEAKERLPIQQESVTYATITLQNYFRLYKKLAGMTGTAKTEEDELYKVYGLSVVVIPTNKPMIRTDQPDQVHRNEEAKWRAVALEIAQTYTRGQPLLIGTTSVEQSERLSRRFAADKLDLFARAKLLQRVVEASDELNDKQRATLKLILSRSLDDAPENYDEALSSRLFHDYDLGAVINAARKMPARDLLRVKQQIGKRGAAQSKLSDRELKELEGISERDLRFAARLEERNLKLDGAQTLCDEIAAHPDDLAKLAPKLGLLLEVALEVYNDLRLSRDEMNNLNRALIESLGDVDAVRGEYRVRASDMDIIVKRLPLRGDDATRLAKKLNVNADPLAAENADATREILGIEESAAIAKVLRDGIPHAVLNAKEHEKEAGIIARAGELHAVTLATNMAGRGVDIKLGGELHEETISEVGRILHRNGVDPYDLTFDQIADALEQIPPASYELDKEHVERFKRYMYERVKVRELGGLRIIGTERHEARRIDNQLRGRSGRQGDAGSSRFYVSLEDEIMRRMGGKGLMDRVWIEDIPIEHDWVTKSLEQAQIKMESYNFDIRKHLLEYDDVLNKQREIIYGQRYRILTKADLRDDVRGWFEEEIARILAENAKESTYAEARLLTHLDSLMQGFFRAENDMWPPYSLALVLRDLGECSDTKIASKRMLDAAQRAMELHRDFVVQAIVPEVVNTFEQEYRAKWDELEDLAKNTLATLRQEAEEANRQLDARALTQGVGQAVGMQLDVRVERGMELSERAILDAVQRAFDVRVVDQVARRVAKRANQEFDFRWSPDGNLHFDSLREQLATTIEDAYTKQANKHLADIERELSERVKSTEDIQGTRLAFNLFALSHTRHAAFDQRTHRRFEVMVPRFPWVHLAATHVGKDSDKLRDEILQYWNQSLDQLVPLRGGAAAFNDLLRELMLSVVSMQWVDYLTAIEGLREGIGLQAFGQRDPLVEYKRRAFEMFQDLYTRIRSQTVTYVFTYQYRGFARLESEARDREARQAIEATSQPVVSRQSSVVSQQSTVGSEQKVVGSGQKPALSKVEGSAVGGRQAESKKPEPARKPVNAPVGQKIGRNDPCWCGSGKKYKNCHMQKDAR
jgi:preprotein translocase subunit SecA